MSDGPRDATESYRRRFDAVTTDSTLPLDEQVSAVLSLGCERLGVENAVVTGFDTAADRFEARAAVGSPVAEGGAVAGLLETLCRRTRLGDDRLCCVPDVADAGFERVTGTAEPEIASFLGAEVQAGAAPESTLCFFDAAPRATSFTESELLFVSLVSRWLGWVYERRANASRLRLANRTLAGAPIGVVILEASPGSNTIVSVNEAFESMTGYSADESIGRDWEFLLGAEEDEAGVADLREAFESRAGVSVDIRSTRKDGTLFLNRVNVTPVRDEAGVVTHFAVFQEDVTERSENERQLAALIGNTVHPTYIKDADGVYQFVNEATTTYFGLSAADVVGKRDEDLFDTGSLGGVREGDEAVLDRGLTITRETTVEIDGTERVFLDNKFPYLDRDGSTIGVMGISQDITERKRRGRELERTQHLLQQAERLANVGGWELVVQPDGPPELRWTDEVYRIHDLPVGADVDVEDAIEFYHPDYQSLVREGVERALETGEAYDVEARLVSATGREAWVYAIGDPVLEDGSVVSVRGSVQDITAQKERELALESLHESTRGLLKTDDCGEAARLVVDAAADVLDDSAFCIYLFDEATNQLRPTAHSEGFAAYCRGEASAVGPADESVLWRSFVTDTQAVVDEVDAETAGVPFTPDVARGVVLPIGVHGVFVTVDRGDGLDDGTRRLVETLVATAAEAFSRIQVEAALRERDAALETQNEQLRRQIRLTDTIRSVDQSLIGATSQERLEATVCERLVEGEDIEFAWIGGLDPSAGVVVPRTWAGDHRGYLDSVSLAVRDAAPEPAAETVASGAPTVVSNAARNIQRGAWRRDALAANVQSVLAVPLAFDEYSYGVVAVYAREPGTFGDLERNVFAELGESIANAVAGASTRQALQSDAAVALSIRVSGSGDLLASIAAEADCTVTYLGMSPAGDESARLFVRTTGADSERVSAALESLHGVREYRAVSESADGDVFEVTHRGNSIVTRLVQHAGQPNSITADGSGLDVTVHVPVSADVRAFVAMLDEEYDVELVSRREVVRPLQTRTGVLETLLEDLTERQLEVLQTAYFAGFFNSPRDTTGEGLASMLGISQPTVNRHLREAERRLVSQVFEADSKPDS